MSESFGIQNLSLDSPIRLSKKGQDTDLFMAISARKVSLQQLVSDWVEDYLREKDRAMVQLMQLFITASGCKGQITLDMLETMSRVEMVDLLVEEFDISESSYPIDGQGATAKKLRSNMNDFILLLVKKTQNSILYDGFFLDNLIQLLTLMSSSKVRAFRHTATFSSLGLMTALVHVWVTAAKVKQNLLSHLEREQAKKTQLDKIEKLAERLDEMDENLTELQEMLSYLFNSVFVHRARDVIEDIRCLCMTQLGLWIIECPNLFLEDSYLKYLGWALSDKAGPVRLCTIKSLLPLYEKGEVVDKMALFTEKFKTRLLSMKLDENLNVSVSAIQLLQMLVGHDENNLTDEECEELYMLVYSKHRVVARAAAEFLIQMQFKPAMVKEHIRTKRGKVRLPNTQHLRHLVQFFIESDKPGFEAYLVDSLINTEMVRDWECMTDLLVEECGPNEEEFDHNEEFALVLIMVEAIKQLVSDEAPSGRSSGKKIPTMKESKQMFKEKELVTAHFMGVLPLVINKYLLDQEKMVKLLSIPQYMNLEMYTTSRQERALDSLLKLMEEVAEKHTDRKVLEEVFRTLEKLCNPDSSINSRCSSTRDRVFDAATAKMRNSWLSFTTLVDSGKEVGQDDMFDFESSLCKLALLYKYHDPGHMDDWDRLFDIIRMDLDEMDETLKEPEVAVIAALEGCYLLLMWAKNHQEKNNGLLEKVEMFVSVCRAIMGQYSISKLGDEAFISICDILVVFPHEEIFETLVNDLTSYMEQEVFSNEEVFEMELSNSEESQFDRIMRQRNVVTSFCKLVVLKVIPAKYLTSVLVNYTRCHDKFGDIAKAAVAELRDTSREICAKVLLMAVVKYGDVLNWEFEDEAKGMKELARRLAMLLGLDGQKNRQAIVQLHKQGIYLALEQGRDRRQLLLGLAEFSGRVLKQDRAAVVNYFNREVKKYGINEEDCVIAYRSSLQMATTEPVGDD